MNFAIELRAKVFEDLDKIHRWYEKRLRGLGDRFAATFFSSLPVLQRNPTVFAPYYRDVRHFLLKRFPYGIYFRVEGETVVVFRVFHGSRNQSALRKSLRDFLA